MAEEEKVTKKPSATPFIVVLVAIAAFLAGSFFTKIQYQKTQPAQAPTPTPVVRQPQEEKVLGTTIGNFSLTEEEVCLEDGKPVVYFFGSERCPHCSWEHPIVEGVLASFEDQVSFHNNMDKPEADQEIWSKYSEINRGAIPFLVLGCRYARVGSGEQLGEEEEEKILTALICKLTGEQPEEVCAQVKELIEQIED